MKTKNVFFTIVSLSLFVMALVVGGAADIHMAAATTLGGESASLPDAGVTVTGQDGAGAATVQTGTEIGDDNFYVNEIDKRITKMRPMRTPIDQITRMAEIKRRSVSQTVEYYSVGTKPIKTSLSAAFEAQEDGLTATISVADPAMISLNDTIRVVGVKGYAANGATQDTMRELMLLVVGKTTNRMPIVIAINGLKNGNNGNTWLPAIPKDTVLIRMGRAASELDVITEEFTNLPTKDENYCQKFIMQVEQSTFDKLSKKEVDWNFSDLEEDAVYDMRIGMENSFYFGIKGYTVNPMNNRAVYTTGGIYYMAGKDIGLGTTTNGVTTVSDDQMVDFLKDIFVGNDSGNGVKIGFCGSDALATLAKMKSERFKVIKEIEHWGLKFTSFDSNFGKLLVMHHELMDLNGKSNEIFVLDPEYLRKKTFKAWERKDHDMKALLIRDSMAVTLTEASTCYLTYPNAHARVVVGTAA
ncbi:MAG: DUF5309 domain-containing protein [Prevotellaceae bacterium]|jgi:hypothetical protein|nr:DUF5309 domain-containing protein [Prevotellaceae bacterium]